MEMRRQELEVEDLPKLAVARNGVLHGLTASLRASADKLHGGRTSQRQSPETPLPRTLGRGSACSAARCDHCAKADGQMGSGRQNSKGGKRGSFVDKVACERSTLSRASENSGL